MGISPDREPRKQPALDEASLSHNGARSRSILPISISIMSGINGHDASRPGRSSFGVQSLSDTIKEAEINDLESMPPVDPRLGTSRPRTPEDAASNPRRSPYRTPFAHALLRKLPPASETSSPPSPGADSVPLSTPRSASMRSLRLSDDESADEGASQAVASSEEDEEAEQPAGLNAAEGHKKEAEPQLIMPSVQIPCRRPFTERGKQVGTLKILVAGQKGVGKTTLIKSIVQSCEDIVHVDPIDPGPSRLIVSPNETIRGRDSFGQHTSPQPRQILASTRAYPSWYSNVESKGRVLRTNRTSDGTVLERNISFIDTPGYNGSTVPAQHSACIMQYIQQHLHHNASFAFMSDSELISIFSGTGGSQVDVVLYLLLGKETLNASQLDTLHAISKHTNLVPIIAQADSFNHQELRLVQNDLYQQVHQADVEMFDIAAPLAEKGRNDRRESLIAVSSIPARDDENIDASLLMSSGYVQPLQSSDLPLLVERLFDPETAAYLRHSALRKFVRWRQQQVNHTPSLSIHRLHNARRAMPPLVLPTFHQSSASSISIRSISDSAAPGAVLVGGGVTERPSEAANEPSSPSSFNSPDSHDAYTVAKVLDHTQREERLAQVRLARWAADLQNALRNERARFAAVKQAERTAWLQERLEESIDPNLDESEKGTLIRRRGQATPVMHRYQLGSDDPLGLFEWRARWSQRGVMVAKVVGGAGIVGAVMVWIVRTWGWGLDLVPDSSSFGGDSGVSSWWWARDW